MPDPILYVHSCTICGAMSDARTDPPHGWRKPCPHKLAVDKAYVEMLDAQRMSYIRAADAQDRIATEIVGDDDDLDLDVD